LRAGSVEMGGSGWVAAADSGFAPARPAKGHEVVLTMLASLVFESRSRRRLDVPGTGRMGE